jgi:hypothetical protein
MLQAPDSVWFAIDRNILKIGGAAPHSWIVHARNVAPDLMMAGISQMNTDQLRDRDLESLRSAIEEKRILFDTGSSTVAPSQTPVMNDSVSKLRDWIDETRAVGKVPKVTVIGHADSTGSDTLNSNLSNKRARHVIEVLVASGIPSGTLTAVGAGPYTGTGEATGAAPREPRLRRSVMFRLAPDSNVPAQEVH